MSVLRNRNSFLYIFVSILFLLVLTGIGIAEDIAPAKEILTLSVEDAIILALQNNTALKIEKLKPSISESQLRSQQSVFDLSLSGSVSQSENNPESGSSSEHTRASLGLSKSLLSGGDISLDLSTDRSVAGTASDGYSSKFSISLSQPLLKGAWDEVNRVDITKAELNVKSTEYELKGYVENLIYQIEAACWDYLLSKKQLKIYEESLKLSEQQLADSQILVDVGKVAQIELVAAKAEVASRQEGLINAQSNLTKARFKLIRLLNPPGSDIWNTDIEIVDELKTADFSIEEIEKYIEVAKKNRPDLNESRLLFERNELDVVVTKNGLLPNMDLFVSLGMSGYAGSFGDSVSSLDSSSDFQVGLQYSMPIGNRSAKERYNQSLISKEQTELSMDNLEQLAIEDVSIAWVEVNRSKEQIKATTASRILQEEKLRAETEKYRVGKSTTLQVAIAQRDLLSSQIAEIQAEANLRKAIVDLYRQIGILLEQYNIEYMEAD